MPAPPLYDFSTLDFSRPVFDIEAIRRINPQRNQMEQLTAVVYVDTVHHGLVGYKTSPKTNSGFPATCPGPLMPGVVMCEATAQLAGFYARKYNLLGGDFVGFGGMDDIRFRIPVVPNCRLVLMARMIDLRPNRRARFDFQGFVNQQMAFSGNMIGVPINRDMGINLGVRPEGSTGE